MHTLKTLWKAFVKIIWSGKNKNSTQNGCKNIETYSQNTSSYNVDLKEVKVKKSTVGYWINKYELNNLMKYSKSKYNSNYFKIINSKEKAYIVGFLAGDGHLSKEGAIVCSVQLSDKNVLDFIKNEIGGQVRINDEVNRSKKKFPKARWQTYDNELYENLYQLLKGRLKEERELPYLNKRLNIYLIQGFMDAEGCFTCGRRKDQNRFWQKVSFTSKNKMLKDLINMLNEFGIKDINLRQKGEEKCHVFEVCDKNRVLRIIELLYKDNDFIIMDRKKEKAIKIYNHYKEELDD